MIKYIAIIIGLITFGFWMSIVGNPHVVETVIGLVLGLIVGFFSYRELNKLFGKFQKK